MPEINVSVYLSSRLEHHHAHVDYPREVTVANSLKLANFLREMADDYFYKTINIEILDNAGGDVSGMRMLQSRFRQLQERDITIATKGFGMIASAAAVTLSCGSLGHRSVGEDAMLLYHLGRVSAGEHMTASKAKMISSRLDVLDQKIILSLIDHILPSAIVMSDTDETNTWTWPLQSFSDTDFKGLDIQPKKFTCEKKCRNFMSVKLLEIFERDAVMSPASAVALGLIDHVVQ